MLARYLHSPMPSSIHRSRNMAVADVQARFDWMMRNLTLLFCFELVQHFCIEHIHVGGVHVRAYDVQMLIQLCMRAADLFISKPCSTPAEKYMGV